MTQIVRQPSLHTFVQPLQIFLEAMGVTEAQLIMVITGNPLENATISTSSSLSSHSQTSTLPESPSIAELEQLV